MLDDSQLARHWDEQANGISFTSRANDKLTYHWRCPDCGRPERSSTYRRRRGDRCPGPRMVPLAKRRPDIAAEWHPTRNGELTPSDVSAHTGTKAWWLCGQCGREWEQRIEGRARSLYTGCKKCRRRAQMSQTNSSVADHPELLAEWHPDNEDPRDVSAHTRIAVLWRCSEGHEWKVSPAMRLRTQRAGAKYTQCPSCYRLSYATKLSIADTRADLAAEWHPANKRSPETTSQWFKHPVLWRCGCGHEWEASPHDRNLSRRAELTCPRCVERLAASGDATAKRCMSFRGQTLLQARPELAELWHPEKGQIGLDKLTAGSNKALWWRCSNGHEWRCGPQTKRMARGCLDCAREAREAARKAKHAAQVAKMAPLWAPLLSWWADEETPPLEKDPRWLNKPYLWRCPEGHEWRMTPKTQHKHGFCRACRLPTLDVGRYPRLIQEYRSEDPVTEAVPWETYLWACSTCGHEWKAKLEARIRFEEGGVHRGGGGCERCLSLATLYPELAAEWHPANNKRSAERVGATANFLAWWCCSEGHEWQMRIQTRVKRFSKGKAACPYCDPGPENVERSIWAGMLIRCRNGHPDYGGRGITVCDRWQDYDLFLADMGRRPSRIHSLDRIDPDGDYTPENCRWATLKQQARNRRDCRKLTFDGETRTLAGWAEHLGMEVHNINNRLRQGLPLREVLDPNLQYKGGGNRRNGRRHGLSKKPEYRAWMAMCKRCTDIAHPSFDNYGGRGIEVCARWLESPEAFLEDMGPRPSPRHSLDRIDNEGNYTPENCRWATRKQQARNKRGCRYLTYRGRTRTVAGWAEHLGLPSERILSRLRLGWTVAEALGKKPRQEDKDRDQRRLFAFAMRL